MQNKTQDRQEMQSARILVVDDTPVSLKVAERVLVNAGYIVYTATDMWEAAKFLERQKVDVLVTDHHLEQDTGLELARMMTIDGIASAPFGGLIVVTGDENRNGWLNRAYREFASVMNFAVVTKGARVGPYGDRASDAQVLLDTVKAMLREEDERSPVF